MNVNRCIRRMQSNWCFHFHVHLSVTLFNLIANLNFEFIAKSVINIWFVFALMMLFMKCSDFETFILQTINNCIVFLHWTWEHSFLYFEDDSTFVVPKYMFLDSLIFAFDFCFTKGKSLECAWASYCFKSTEWELWSQKVLWMDSNSGREAAFGIFLIQMYSKWRHITVHNTKIGLLVLIGLSVIAENRTV